MKRVTKEKYVKIKKCNARTGGGDPCPIEWTPQDIRIQSLVGDDVFEGMSTVAESNIVQLVTGRQAIQKSNKIQLPPSISNVTPLHTHAEQSHVDSHPPLNDNGQSTYQASTTETVSQIEMEILTNQEPIGIISQINEPEPESPAYLNLFSIPLGENDKSSDSASPMLCRQEAQSERMLRDNVEPTLRTQDIVVAGPTEISETRDIQDMNDAGPSGMGRTYVQPQTRPRMISSDDDESTVNSIAIRHRINSSTPRLEYIPIEYGEQNIFMSEVSENPNPPPEINLVEEFGDDADELLQTNEVDDPFLEDDVAEEDENIVDNPTQIPQNDNRARVRGQRGAPGRNIVQRGRQRYRRTLNRQTFPRSMKERADRSVELQQIAVNTLSKIQNTQSLMFAFMLANQNVPILPNMPNILPEININQQQNWLNNQFQEWLNQQNQSIQPVLTHQRPTNPQTSQRTNNRLRDLMIHFQAIRQLIKVFRCRKHRITNRRHVTVSKFSFHFHYDNLISLLNILYILTNF